MSQAASDLEDYVRHKIESGEFSDREEFAKEAIRVYRELEDRYLQFRADVQESIRQAERGEVAPMDMAALKVDLIAEFDPQRVRKSCAE